MSPVPESRDRRGSLDRSPEKRIGLTAMVSLLLGTPGRAARPWALSRQGADGGQEVWSGLPARSTQANLPALLLEMAADGLGVTATAELLARPLVEAGRLLRLLPDWQLPPESLWAVVPGRRLMPAKTRALVALLADTLAPCRPA